MSDENKKETDKIIDNLATTIVDNIQSITDNCIKKAKYDKSFNTTVLGVNQNFSDKVPEDKQRELIEKFKIPDEYSSPVYYTFMINGEYYVKASKNEYYLYDEICVRVPNGSWDNMYIEINLPRDKESDCIGEWSDKGKNSAVIINTDKPNTIDGDNGFCAGRGNTIKGDYNFGGGGFNEINGEYNFFGGSSTVNGDYNFSCGQSKSWDESLAIKGNYNMLGGANCQIDGDYNFCSGYGSIIKKENDTDAICNICHGMSCSIVDSDHCINLGSINEINKSDYSAIIGYCSYIKNLYQGKRNYIFCYQGYIGVDTSNPNERRYAYDNFIGGGIANRIYDGEANSIIGGWENYIYSKPNEWGYLGRYCVSYSGILCGRYNKITAIYDSGTSMYDTIIGGYYNEINNGNTVSIISTGDSKIEGSSRSCILGGYGNKIENGYESVIIGGCDNTLTGGANAVIIGGYYNRTSDKDGQGSGNGVILGGHDCTLEKSVNLVTCGFWNKTNISDDRFSVGNGSGEDSRSNAFRVTSDGNIYAGAAVNSTGADFAEMREWSDDNPNNEDRRGLFVVYDDSIDYKIGEYAKIRIANENDDLDNVLGIVSSNPTVVGNTASETWQGMWQRDIFGNVITEEKHFPAETREAENPETGEKETVVVIPEHTEIVPVVNPMYDGTKEYKGRKDRPEWGVVGMLGMVVTADDGSCKMLSYCKVAQDGKATHSENKTKFRVVARLDETHIAVEIKP